MPVIDVERRSPRLLNYGFLQSIDLRELTNPHFRVELSAEQESCHFIQPYDPNWCPPITGNIKSDPERFGDEIPGFPFVGELALECSPGTTHEDVRAEAIRTFESDWTRFVESQYEIYFLSQGAVDLGAPVSPLCAYSRIAGALANTPGCGDGLGIIYLDVQTAILLSDGHLFEEQDGLLYDLLGNLIVIGRGFTPGTIFAESNVPIAWIGKQLVLDQNDDLIRTVNTALVRIENDGVFLSTSCCRFTQDVVPCV